MGRTVFNELVYTLHKVIVKYLIGILWLIGSLLVFCRAYNYYHHDPIYYYVRKILGNCLCISRGTAPIINLTIGLIMLPVCRTFNECVHLLLSRISTRCLAFYLEKVKTVHLTLSMGIILVSTVHTIAHIVNAFNYVRLYDADHPDINWASSGNDSILRLIFATPTGLSGCLMLLILLVMALFASRPMRDRYFNRFLVSHHLFVVFFGLMYLHPLSNIIKYQTNLAQHPASCDPIKLPTAANVSFVQQTPCLKDPIFTAGHKSSWIWPTIALALFSVDAVARFIRRNSQMIETVDVRIIGANTIGLELRATNRQMKSTPGQYVLVQCPKISNVEWHPFTLVSRITANNPMISLIVAVRGDWTHKLHEFITSGEYQSKHDGQLLPSLGCAKHMSFLIDGPFPSPMEMINKSKIAICIAAGVGVTPFIAVLKQLVTHTRPLHLNLVWIVPRFETVRWIEAIVTETSDKLWNLNRPDRLQVDVFVTRDVAPPTEKYRSLRLHNGRPAWDRLFKYWALLYERKHISLFCCGSKTMNREVKSHCDLQNCRSHNQFSFWHEAFN